MTAKLKIRDTSGWTIFIFGALALLLGFFGLIRPEILLSILGFDVLDRSARAAGDYTLVFLTASSMASFNVGAYYMLAALNDKAVLQMDCPFSLPDPHRFHNRSADGAGSNPLPGCRGLGTDRRDRHRTCTPRRNE
jgi:hypothetical protein